MSGMKKESVWIRGSYRREGRGGENSEVCHQLGQLLTKVVCGGGTGASVTATVRAVEAGGRSGAVRPSSGAHAYDPRGQGRKTVNSRQT